MTDPLEPSVWSAPGTVDGFSRSAPNPALMAFAARELNAGASRVLDVGCGAGRNALPLADQGWDVLGTDLSWPMLRAAADRSRAERPRGRVRVALATMEHLPVRSHSMDLIVAHGIWNLARSAAQFRLAIRETARVARAGAGLFVFTFSRTTLSPDARPVAGEPFVFTEFSGEPQCFLTARELAIELEAAGVTADPAVPLNELNRRPAGVLRTAGVPVILEGAFRYGG